MLVVVPPKVRVGVVGGTIRHDVLEHAWFEVLFLILLVLADPVEGGSDGCKEFIFGRFAPREWIQRDSKIWEPVEVYHLQQGHLVGVVGFEEVLKLPYPHDGLAKLVARESFGPWDLTRDDEVFLHHHVSSYLEVSQHGTHGLLKGHVEELPRVAPVKVNGIKLSPTLPNVLHFKASITDAPDNITKAHTSKMFRPLDIGID
mmetsp:Transcript_26495/g.76465  ORF Transcript_26495/g.76465 Transcript_26495/m.76465 type:complete len:202 (-) Transcript_26495:1977-2582(-)